MHASERRVVLVTGGATGIGAATVRHFVENDWDVAICHFGEAERGAAMLARDQALAAGVRAMAIDLDVTSDTQCRAAVREAVEAFGRIDALVCSAGTTRIVPHRDLDGLTAEDFDLTSKVNTVGPFQMSRACADALRASRGAIVIVSSYGGVMGSGSSIAYAASKGATNTLTLSLARALAPEVRVNAVCPAIVSGGLAARIDPEGFARRSALQLEKAPLGRIARPEDVASNIVWIAACDRLMTGNVIVLDCGMHLNADS
ncbi:SDR family NAD(P)-dependent oxidoreductase [Blastomonas fulva]|uniref:SDR family NAD(P)-dependent oxidoreductase n=1 Tax=Blastomonas fulva TaxID=1550728 RepID=UPI003F6E5B5C